MADLRFNLLTMKKTLAWFIIITSIVSWMAFLVTLAINGVESAQLFIVSIGIILAAYVFDWAIGEI